MKIAWNLAFIFVHFGLSQANCKDGWTLLKGYGCYFFDGEESLTWEEAREFCLTQDGSLVQIESETEEVLIVREAHKRDLDYWIGLSDSVAEDHFVWNVTGEELGFDSWAENEPAGNENQNCVAALANNTYFWKEDDCDLRYRPLCFGPELVNPCAEGLTYIAAADMCILLGGVGTMSWQQGQNYCKNSGGRLIEVYDEGIENAVRSSILSNGIFEQGLWMGLQDFANEGEFIWDDSGLKADYFDWDGIQPDSGTIGNCVVFYGSEYKWVTGRSSIQWEETWRSG
ncbi:lectin BRA-3-like [Tigriopus californicus]|uniref:lectin BRA-3-like n=1 Tax=Tigriopus californicus TaxID=6832 RepID=UPI0027DA908D|nr:lectin BRA-3-like [Tigriopus californicus]